jgi:hypothetical protein
VLVAAWPVRARFVPGAAPGNLRCSALGTAPNGIKVNYALPASPWIKPGGSETQAGSG